MADEHRLPTGVLIDPVILCGGSGTRLWPSSRHNQPKQFAITINGLSLFQNAVRLVTAAGFRPVTVVTGGEQRFRVIEQMARLELAPQTIILEPDGRNTGPAVLAAALNIAARDPDAIMLVLPSDHHIADHMQFLAAVDAALPSALAGDLVTFGISPTRPETGYGYLELCEPGAQAAGSPQPLRAFVEKPDIETAKSMLESGMHLWNSGIFLMSVKSVIEAFREHAPDIGEAVSRAMQEATDEGQCVSPHKEGWFKSASISIDYAIMEKARNLSVMPFNGRWSDLGDWASVWRDGDADGLRNVLSGQSLALDCRDSILRNEVSDQLVVGLDLDNMVVVATPDAILVAPQSSSQKVGRVVNQLRQMERPEAIQSRRDHRPWGWFDSLAIGDGFQVKQIVVEPGQALSLQSHVHRAEHWIILRGNAHVTVDDARYDLAPGDYVFIPAGAIHRLENRGDVEVAMVELQVGSYLGEDDIVRYADRYARAKAG